MRTVYRPEQVQLDQACLGFEWDRFEGSPHTRASVVDPNADAAECRNRGARQLARLDRVGNIGRGTASERPPSVSQSLVVSSSSSRRRAARTTLAPRLAKAWAVASPIPLEAPVITTVVSRKLCTISYTPFLDSGRYAVNSARRY